MTGWGRGVERQCGHLNQSLGKVDCALRLPVSVQAQGTMRGRGDSSRTQDTSRRVQACGFAPYFLSRMLKMSNAGGLGARVGAAGMRFTFCSFICDLERTGMRLRICTTRVAASSCKQLQLCASMMLPLQVVRSPWRGRRLPRCCCCRCRRQLHDLPCTGSHRQNGNNQTFPSYCTRRCAWAQDA